MAGVPCLTSGEYWLLFQLVLLSAQTVPCYIMPDQALLLLIWQHHMSSHAPLTSTNKNWEFSYRISLLLDLMQWNMRARLSKRGAEEGLGMRLWLKYCQAEDKTQTVTFFTSATLSLKWRETFTILVSTIHLLVQCEVYNTDDNLSKQNDNWWVRNHIKYMFVLHQLPNNHLSLITTKHPLLQAMFIHAA